MATGVDSAMFGSKRFNLAIMTSMGKTKGPYEAEYPEGTFVRIADRATLERFMRDWRLHNKLQDEQLAFAEQRTRVKSVSFYHGGDELYLLEDVPGLWHEQCVRADDE